ncbi:MAG TPA: thiol:disulfide interchange protein DsbA/DsbL [Gammaproteobacteria bacterium]|nr:thiol:disulfide interchange protein DsbA/DsbL [Gammaproteobacteria bacterium]
MKPLSLLALTFLCLTGLAQAADAPTAGSATYKQGVQYQVVLPAQPVSTKPGQIEVIDFFWYGCPHCNAFEPYLENWERTKPANVVLVRVPAVLEPDWEAGARAYYVAQALGILSKSHKATFDEIHQNKDVLQTEQDFERFYVKAFGVDPKKFESLWSSPDTDAKIQQSEVLAERYGLGIFGVPTIVVNGKWLTGGDLVNNASQIMNVANYLIAQEEAALPAAAK